MTAPRDDSIATAEGPLQIHAIHHASLMLTWNGKHILVDPAPAKDKGDAPYKGLPKADVILYTHDHYDHFDTALLAEIAGPQTEIIGTQDVYNAVPKPLQAQLQVLANGGKTAAGGIAVEAVAMYNTTSQSMQFHPKGRGNGYILSLGGKRIYIAGDSEEAPELAHLPGIEAAFLPMNQPYTMKVQDAAHWVHDFKPRLVYPYHFRNADGSLSDLAAFKAAVGDASEVRVLDWY
jgi:L-ascorbate metabolism protein UlaG (beta-lactamase superfamily)